MTANLNDVLGFDRLIPSLTKRFVHDQAKRLVIRGPSGTGKTTLALAVSERIADAGCSVIWLRGDAGRAEESYFPIRSVLQTGNIGRLIGRGAKLLSGLAEDFLPMGRTTAKTLVGLLPSGSGADKDVQSSDVPRDFSSMLARLSKRHRVFLIADDIQYFDSKTLELLAEILDPEPAKLSSDNEGIGLLSIVNTGIKTSPATASRIDSLTATVSATNLNYCTSSGFERVLKGLGLATVLPLATVRLLYDCSGGHLHIAKFIVEELRTVPFGEISSSEYSDLLHYVIQKRLEHSTPEPETLRALMCSAAHIGRIFVKEELICLTGLDEVTLALWLRTAATLGFVELEGEIIRFSHDIVRSYFLKYAFERKSQYSAKYSDCLRILRPYDYYSRCLSLIEADKSNQAIVAYCQGVLAEWRAGRTESHQTARPMVSSVQLSPDIQAYLAAMHEAHLQLAIGGFRDAQLSLATTHEGIDKILRAERDYVLAEALLKDLGEDQSEEAKRVLDEWNDLRDEEPELWCRMRLLLLLAHVQLGRFDDARKTERQIASFLATRGKFDRGAERQLNRLLCLSEMHSTAEVSRRRINQACQYYEQKLADKGFIDLYEYFICLTNKSGNAITNLALDEAIKDSARALLICREYPTVRLPAQWAAANNFVVATVLDNRMMPSEAISCLDELLHRFPQLDDDLLLNSNIGGLAIIDGALDAALAAFARNEERLQSTPNIDPYYRLLSDSNKAIALHLKGSSEGKDLWDACAPMADRLAPSCRAELKMRHKIISPLFETKASADQTSWDRDLNRAISNNPRYRAQGFPRGVFLSDIQIWSSF